MTSISSLSLQQQVLLLQQQHLAASQAANQNNASTAASSGAATNPANTLAEVLTGTGTAGLATGSLAGFIDDQEQQTNTGQTVDNTANIDSLLDQEAGIPSSSTSGSGWDAINQSASATSSVTTDMQAFLTQIGL